MLWTEALELLRRMGGSESVCTPDSVQADEPPWVTIPLGRRLLDGSCGLPGFSGRAALTLLDLAPGGVCRATRVTPGAGALLPHRFTLTCARRTGPSAVCSLLHCPAGRPDWVLPSTVPCGVRTFLGSRPCCHGPIRGHPANSLPPPAYDARAGVSASCGPRCRGAGREVDASGVPVRRRRPRADLLRRRGRHRSTNAGPRRPPG